MTPQSISFSKDPLVPKDKFRYVGPKSSVKTKQTNKQKKTCGMNVNIFSTLFFTISKFSCKIPICTRPQCRGFS